MTKKQTKNVKTLDFGKYGKLTMQQGSLSDHKRNGVIDTDIISGLIAYLTRMDKQKKSQFNYLAIGNLQSAYMFLRYRRINQHIQNEHDKKAKEKVGQ